MMVRAFLFVGGLGDFKDEICMGCVVAGATRGCDGG